MSVSRRRVVVADNDPAVLELLSLDLGLEGHEVVAAVPDGEAAVRACLELAPDVLIVDLKLGKGIDGVEVARQVRRAGLRVIVHTNYVNPAIADRTAAAGATLVEKGSLSVLRRAVAD